MNKRFFSDEFYKQVKEITGNKDFYKDKVSNILSYSDENTLYYKNWNDVDNHFNNIIDKDLGFNTKSISDKHKYSSIKELHEMILLNEGTNIPTSFIYDTLKPFLYALGILPFFTQIQKLESAEAFSEKIKIFLALIFFIICEEKYRRLYNYILSTNKNSTYHAAEVLNISEIYYFVFEICVENNWDCDKQKIKYSSVYRNNCDICRILRAQNNVASCYGYYTSFKYVASPFFRDFLDSAYQEGFSKILDHFHTVLFNIERMNLNEKIQYDFISLHDFILINKMDYLLNPSKIQNIIECIKQDKDHAQKRIELQKVNRINKKFLSNINKLRDIELKHIKSNYPELNKEQITLIEENYKDLLFNLYINSNHEVRTPEEVFSLKDNIINNQLKESISRVIFSNEDIVFSLNPRKQNYLKKFNELSVDQQESIFVLIDSYLEKNNHLI